MSLVPKELLFLSLRSPRPSRSLPHLLPALWGRLTGSGPWPDFSFQEMLLGDWEKQGPQHSPWRSPSSEGSPVRTHNYRNGSFEVFQFLLGVLFRQVAFPFSLVNSRFQGIAVISKGQGQLYKHVLLGTRVQERCQEELLQRMRLQVCSLHEHFTSVPGTSRQSSCVHVKVLLPSTAQRMVEW